MKSFNYWLWLQKALGPGAANTGRIFDFYDSAEEIWHDTDLNRRTSGVFTPLQIEKMSKCDIYRTYETVSECGEAEVDIVTPEDGEYPRLLLETADFPLVLFVSGDLSVVNRKIPIAIVGTRTASARGITAASELSKALSLCGFAVISGGALGVDSAAHTGALVSGNETVAVLGCGHSDRYLKENRPLREVISKNGATVSEYSPKTVSQKGFFPVRNRLISGMSVGVIVVEAKIKSGSLITAARAKDQGRDVFAIPAGELLNASNGCGQLISDGAVPVFCPLDVLGQYLMKYPEKITINEEADLSADITGLDCDLGLYKKDFEKINSAYEKAKEEKRLFGKPEKRELTDGVSDAAKKLYAVFDRDPVSVRELTEKAVMPVNSLLGALTELELYGYITLLPNSKYTVK